MKSKSILFRITLFFLSLIIVTSCAGGPSFHGTLVEPAKPAAEIGLADQNGNPFRIEDSKGKVVLVFFGFTNCPDECPLTAAHLKQALEVIGDRAQDVRVVMVSTDPVRDTPQAVKEFLGKFNPDFVGIPGSEEDLSRIWNDYGVMVLHAGETHSSFIYVVDQTGNLRLTFTAETSPDDIASDLNILLTE
jgi:protein SCO1/2